jgi:cysteinyl-tRNA synthetase
MVSLIQTLIERGHAYEANGEILFDTASMPDYGRLSRRNLDEQQAGARVAVDAHKKNPADFVLWKESSAEEPGWDAAFRLGDRTVTIRGRPGWHIECSAMSAAYLGEVFDIHGGGLDLIFPHHENEIAQSRCAHGTGVMANYWLHNGFLQVEGKKMAKSEGNFVTIHELLHTEKFGGRKWPGEVLRLAMLMTHYREPIDFSVRKLEEAENILAKLRRKAEGAEAGEVDMQFVDALKDDLDLSLYFRLLNEGNLPSSRLVAAADLVGIDLSAKNTDIDVEEFVKRRLAFIREKNWPEADRIRDELLHQGVQLMDGKDPETGERVTTWEVKR